MVGSGDVDGEVEREHAEEAGEERWKRRRGIMLGLNGSSLTPSVYVASSQLLLGNAGGVFVVWEQCSA